MKRTRSFFSLICLAIVFSATNALRAAPTVELAAREQADAWLAVVDKGEYGEAWARSAPFFRIQISREEFVKALEKIREDLGAVEKRQLMRLFYTVRLPGSPDAHYVMIQYKTKFANREEPVVEIITPLLINSDGDPVPVVDDPLTVKADWQVAGYYIQ
ncbi:DUF4019 domain-containing protein [Cerasicoccus maritimus]|uniref:DUF4019 domain-containing protein n=1 Tax=Cerasicoccus maritimus TaxID=490089 RepID=UPI002852A267|nr:DUF4019 domain-containing protein [Cerasicoccus maritimus]